MSGRVDYLGFACKDFGRYISVFEKYGFSKWGNLATDGKEVAFLIQKNICFALSEGLAYRDQATQFVTKNTEGLFQLSFEIEDAVALKNRFSRAGIAFTERNLFTPKGRGKALALGGNSELLITFVQYRQKKTFSGEHGILNGLTHAILLVKQGELEKWTTFYGKVFEATPQDEKILEWDATKIHVRVLESKPFALGLTLAEKPASSKLPPVVLLNFDAEEDASSAKQMKMICPFDNLIFSFLRKGEKEKLTDHLLEILKNSNQKTAAS